MSPFEYVLPMVSILVGLAIGDLSLSLHRLLRARRRVRWDWLPLAAALLVLLLILFFWWAFYAMGRAEVWTRYWAFLVLAAALIGMFLLASAALPDAVPEDGLDLAAYYDENRRYFWVLFAVFNLLAFVLDFLVYTDDAVHSTGPLRAIPTLSIAAVLLSLAFVRRRAYHTVVVLLLLVVFGWQWSQLRLA
ncbi:MAG: hypothetical protein ACJ8GN_04505 [Longimicrobiaceae bacterium]